MATSRGVAINVHRILNSSPTPHTTAIAARTNPLLSGGDCLPRSLGYGPYSPFTSQSNGSQSHDLDLSNEESKRRLFNKLLYRSKQRGFLEWDLVLGKWVEENIHSMNENGVKALIDVLDLENPDLWKWVSGQEQPPESVSINPVFAAVREKVIKNLATFCS
ncbi:hypothetical protein L6164_010875 [Bauhinia variegata]|uniref:Uncharacterized protein n=1 Tax=Bauhinia variegata TaxID=167791 RepID=A0ACB9P456_BAUVA|nr:hypothetical protein L6164_010875 [Bauhinia variegata]